MKIKNISRIENFKGVFISREIWFNPDTSYSEKALLAVIESVSHLKSGCTYSLLELSKLCNVHTKTIDRGILKLKKLGLILHEGRKGKRRILRSNLKGEEINGSS